MSAVDWPLLKRVSRSFYLTLRLLPEAVRDSIALAYLLARLTDTKADGATNAGEKELLKREAELMGELARSPDREDIETVWRTIREGQEFDGERFASEEDGPLTAEERERYTYLVAGCVGEFWTRLCMRKVKGFAARTEREMLEWGVRFGKGLQLVNILRDRRGDWRLGRVYVSDEEVPATLSLARECLEDAERYTRAIRPWRLRTACALPLLIGRETLELVAAHPTAERVRISRGRVWVLLVRSALFGRS